MDDLGACWPDGRSRRRHRTQPVLARAMTTRTPPCTELCTQAKTGACIVCEAWEERDRFVHGLPRDMCKVARSVWRWVRHTGNIRWVALDLTGLRAIWEKISPPPPGKEHLSAPTFFLWFIGVYVALFGLASQRYEHALDRLENRTNVIITQLGTNARKTVLSLIIETQREKIPVRPFILPLWSPICSLFGAPHPDKDNIQTLRKVVEGQKEDLKEVHMDGIDLQGTDMSGGKLWSANLKGAHLEGAKLWLAELFGAHLEGAHLEGAQLWRTHLEQAYLEEAHLAGANLSKTYLKETDLRGADLLGVINWRDIEDIDLANIVNIRNPPQGFRHWAFCRGAVEIQDNSEWLNIRNNRQPRPSKPPDCSKN